MRPSQRKGKFAFGEEQSKSDIDAKDSMNSQFNELVTKFITMPDEYFNICLINRGTKVKSHIMLDVIYNYGYHGLFPHPTEHRKEYLIQQCIQPYYW